MTNDVDAQVTAIADRKKAALVFKAGPGPGDKVEANLTPVGTEKRKVTIPDVPEVFLTGEAVADIERDLRRQAAVLIEVADGLAKYQSKSDAILGDTTERKPTPQEARFAGTDESFADRMARLKDEAERSVYADKAPAYDPPPTPGAKPIDLEAEAKRIFADDLKDDDGWSDWVCPKHGDANVKNILSKGGRKYRACEHCEQYEKR